MARLLIHLTNGVTYGSGDDSIHILVCRIKTRLAAGLNCGLQAAQHGPSGSRRYDLITKGALKY